MECSLKLASRYLSQFKKWYRAFKVSATQLSLAQYLRTFAMTLIHLFPILLKFSTSDLVCTVWETTCGKPKSRILFNLLQTLLETFL